MSFNTPLRYPGGKGRLTQYMGSVIEMNGILDGHYVEPFAGGAGIAISLLLLEYVQKIHLNDVNPSVHAFWEAVLDHTEELCRLIVDTPVTMEEWRRQRAVQQQADKLPALELGFSTFFLNRTNRSGIISGGVIGGKEQTGAWKLDARFNKPDLINRIERIAAYRSRISLMRMDAAAFIRNYLPTISDKALVYLDPPYYVKGRGLYQNHYRHEEHAEIAELVRFSIRQHWIVSYDNHIAIRELYRGFRQQEFGLHYSANNRFRGSEIIIFQDCLKTPDKVQPSRVAT
jgi:DNA adenine methylase